MKLTTTAAIQATGLKRLAFSLLSNWPVILLFALATFALLWRLGQTSLEDWDEAIYAQVSKEIVQSGDWVTLHWQGKPYFNKPPLLMWITALLFLLFDINEFWARAASAFSGISLILVTYLVGKFVYDRYAGFLAGIILLTSYQFVTSARSGTIDIMLTLVTFLAVYAYLRLKHGSQVWWYVIGSACGAAFMLKSAAGTIVPAIIALAVILDRRCLMTGRSRHFWGGLFLAVIIVAPWHVLLYIEHKQVFIDQYLKFMVLKRATTSLEEHTGTAYFYVDRLQKYFSPWFYLVPFALALSLRENLKNRSRSPILLLVFIIVFGLYTLVQTKLRWYIVPLYPALAIMTAAMIIEALKSYESLAFSGLVVATGVVALTAPLRIGLIFGAILLFLFFLWLSTRRSSYQVAVVVMAAFLVMAGIHVIQPLYRTGEDPAAKLARLAGRAHFGDREPLIVFSGLSRPSSVFYSDRPIQVAYTRENLFEFTKDSLSKEIILAKEDVESLSSDYEIHPLSEAPPYIYATISLKEKREVVNTPSIPDNQVVAQDVENRLVTVEIHYYIPGASEVFLVWGINGWMLPPEETHPAGTFVKDELVYTPMVRQGDTFVAKIQVPAGATIDYVFHITQAENGVAMDVWDANGDPKQDYHTVAIQGDVVEVQAPPAIVSQVTVVELDLKWPGLSLALLAGAGLVFVTAAVRAWAVHPGWLSYLPHLLRRLITSHLLKVAGVILILATLGFSLVGHYGFSTDETGEISMVRWNVDLITKGRPIPGDWRYYGPVFNVAAEASFQIQEYLGKGFSHHLLESLSPDSDEQFLTMLPERVKVKKPFTFLFSLLAYIAVAGIVGMLCGVRYAWFGPVVLALFPRFWGHSFFNPKDIPFAAFFIFCTLAGIYLVELYLKAGSKVRIGANPITAASILYGILAGLLTGIRVGGFIVIFFILIAYIVVRLSRANFITNLGQEWGAGYLRRATLTLLKPGLGKVWKDVAHLGAGYGLIVAAWLATTILVHPASWSNPPGWFFEALTYLSKHTWSKEVLFAGQFISAQALPWYYLPRWILITVPIIFQLAFVGGLILILAGYSKFSDIQRAGIVLVLLQIFFLPILAMVKNSTMYDGMRQFLFVLPGMAAIAAAGLVWLYQKLPGKNARIVAAASILLIFATICFDLITLHPYEYIYFNRVFGGLKSAYQHYETDYWGLSIREATEWLNQNGNPKAPVVAGGAFHATKLFADPEYSVVELDYDLREKMDIARPFYYMAMPKHGLQDIFPDCAIVYQVVRQETPLSVVKACYDRPAATQGGVAEADSAATPAPQQPPASGADAAWVTQEIRYRMPEAGQVFLVWGINGWASIPSDVHPAGTFVKDEIMYTPMVRQEDTFTAQVQVPAGAIIDYVFQITEASNGATLDVWDANGNPKQDYHTLAEQNGVTEIEAAPAIRDQVDTSIFNRIAKLQWRELFLFLIGLSIVAGSLLLSYVPRFRTVVRLSPWFLPLPFVAILLIAAILRLNHLSQPFIDAFNWRQTSVAMMADNFYHTSWNIFYPEVNWSGPGPNYQGREFQTVTYLAALLYNFTGQQDWVGRLIAVLFGLWGIFALYQLVRRVWDEKRALASAAVMALLPGSIVIERSFLPDPAMVALVVTSFWLFVLYLQTERQSYLWLAGLIGAWGFCTKVPGLIVGLPMAYALVAILGYKRLLHLRKLAALGLFALLALAPVIAYYLWARHLALSYPPYHFAGDGNWLWQDGLQAWLDHHYFLTDLSRHFSDWMWSTPVILLVGFGLLLRPSLAMNGQEMGRDPKPVSGLGQGPWLFHWWFVAGVIYYLMGAEELVRNPWNFHIINPAAAALAGHAIIVIGSLAARITRKPTALPVAVVILFIIGVIGYHSLQAVYYPYAREDYRLGLALRKVTQPDDLIITIGSNFGDPVVLYYSQRRGWSFPPARVGQAWNQLPQDDHESIQLFEELRTQGATWLGIVNKHYQELWEDHPELAEYIENTGEFIGSNRGGVIYRLPSPTELNKQTSLQDQLSAEVSLVSQEIRYHTAEAGEVSLRWGINGWEVLPEEMRPAETIIKDAAMQTPMTRVGDSFVTGLQVPAGATIDYGFLITKTPSGAAVEVWDAGQGAKQVYRTVAPTGEVVEVQATPNLVKQAVTGMSDTRLQWLIFLALLIGLMFVVGVGLIRRRHTAQFAATYEEA